MHSPKHLRSTIFVFGDRGIGNSGTSSISESSWATSVLEHGPQHSTQWHSSSRGVKTSQAVYYMEQSPSLEQSTEQGPLTTRGTQPTITKEESIPESDVNHCLSWNQGAQFGPRLVERSRPKPTAQGHIRSVPDFVILCPSTDYRNFQVGSVKSITHAWTWWSGKSSIKYLSTH